MSLSDRINNIRQKPEHIRLRYAWIFAGVGTACVVVVWFLSLAARRDEAVIPKFSEEQMEMFDEIGEQKKSMQETTDQVKKMMEKQENKQEF